VRARDWGDPRPDIPLRTFDLRPLKEKFADTLAKSRRGPDECWPWVGALTEGYGYIKHDNRNIPAHRLSYAAVNGEIPPKREIDHICRNKSCVNPNHLRSVTTGQNAQNRPAETQCGARSGIRGVHWVSQTQKWAARAKVNGRRYEAGQFDTIAEAQAAVVELRLRLHTHNDVDRTKAS
jgi:hypothetical protein